MRRRDFGSMIAGALAGLVGWRPKRQEVVKSDLVSTIKWIAVDERLPVTEIKPVWGGNTKSESSIVLIAWDGYVGAGYWSDWYEFNWKKDIREKWMVLDRSVGQVTHWAELPKAPE